jgi:hypothetical protein
MGSCTPNPSQTTLWASLLEMRWDSRLIRRLQRSFWFCKIEFFGDLSWVRFFVFWELRGVLLPEFGD